MRRLLLVGLGLLSTVVVGCGAGAGTTSLPAVPDATEAVAAAPVAEASMACPDGDSATVEYPDSSGDDGAITREMLGEGTRLLVTDEAIAAANDPVFAEARQTWDSVSDLVAQIDYQLSFRGYVDYMSRDLAHIAALLVERPTNMGSQSMGLYMSEAEVAEMQRRAELGDRIEEVVVLVTGIDESALPEGDLPDYGPNFGGIWMDQLDGGRIVLAVVDASIVPVDEVAAIVGGEDHLRVIEQQFSFNQVEGFRRQLDAELEALGIARDIAAVRSERGRLLEVRVSDPASFPDSVGAGLPEGAFTVVEGPTVEEANSPGGTDSPEITGCADEPAIVGTWLLHELTLDGVTYGLDDPMLLTGEYPDVAAWVSFGADGRFNGAAPCNDFQGGYSLEGSTLQIFDATVSAVACDPPMIMDAEVSIVRTLSNEAVIDEVVFEGPDTLTLVESAQLPIAEYRFHRASDG